MLAVLNANIIIYLVLTDIYSVCPALSLCRLILNKCILINYSFIEFKNKLHTCESSNKL